MDNVSDAEMLHSRTPYSDATRCRKKKSSNIVKRPMNAFMCFSQWERLKIIRVDPERHNAEISKELGRRWRELSASEKRPFYERSKHLNELHKIEFPDYKYRPRKKRDHSLKISAAPVISASESSSEALHNNNHNNSSNSTTINNTNNITSKTSKKPLKKLNCRGRTRLFSSSMLVQRAVGTTKSPDSMANNQSIPISVRNGFYCSTEFPTGKLENRLPGYQPYDTVESGEHVVSRPMETQDGHPLGSINNLPAPVGSINDCVPSLRSRSVETPQNSYNNIYKSLGHTDDNQWMNYDTNHHYFPIYRNYQEEQQHQQQLYSVNGNNVRDHFAGDGHYSNGRPEYVLTTNTVNAGSTENFYGQWSHETSSYLMEEQFDDKNAAAVCSNNSANNANNTNSNSNFYNISNVENTLLYSETTQPIRSSFYSQDLTNPSVETWQDYPMSRQPITDYHRSYSVSSASSTSRSPTSSNFHSTDEGMYMNADFVMLHKTLPSLLTPADDTAAYDVKNFSMNNRTGSSEFVRHAGFYAPLLAFTNQDTAFLDA